MVTEERKTPARGRCAGGCGRAVRSLPWDVYCDICWERLDRSLPPRLTTPGPPPVRPFRVGPASPRESGSSGPRSSDGS